MNPFQDLTDEELMIRYGQGSYQAFEVIYTRHKDKIYSYLKKRMKNDEAIDEVFQNVFVKLHKQRSNYDARFILLKWLYTICRSELLDYCKKKKLYTVEFDEVQHTGVEENKREFDLDKVEALTDNERKAIELKFFSEKDHKEISRNLMTSESNARKLVSRGLAKVRLAMKGEQKS